MPIRSLYYGFHFKNLDNETLPKRGYDDIQKFARYKFNMIGLDNHHYSHLEMEIPNESGKKYGECLAEIFKFARKLHLEPRVGGWARWFGDKSSLWNLNLQTLEGDIFVAPLWAKLLRDKFKTTDQTFGLIHAPWEYDYDTPEGIERLEMAADYAWSIAPYVVHLPIRKAPEGKNLIISAAYEGINISLTVIKFVLDLYL